MFKRSHHLIYRDNPLSTPVFRIEISIERFPIARKLWQQWFIGSAVSNWFYSKLKSLWEYFPKNQQSRSDRYEPDLRAERQAPWLCTHPEINTWRGQRNINCCIYFTRLILQRTSRPREEYALITFKMILVVLSDQTWRVRYPFLSFSRLLLLASKHPPN